MPLSECRPSRDGPQWGRNAPNLWRRVLAPWLLRLRSKFKLRNILAQLLWDQDLLCNELFAGQKAKLHKIVSIWSDYPIGAVCRGAFNPMGAFGAGFRAQPPAVHGALSGRLRVYRRG